MGNVKKECGVGATANSRKRKSKADEEDAADCQFVGKRPRKEIEFHKRKMEENLKDAMSYAKEGDKFMFGCSVENARTEAQKCNMTQGLEAKISEIKKHLNPQNQNNYHVREMNKHLGHAMYFAKEGDKFMFDCSLENARMEAQKCNMTQGLEAKISEIKKHLTPQNQNDHHVREMNKHLGHAMYFAKEGNKLMLDFSVENARKEALKCNMTKEYQLKVSEIFGVFYETDKKANPAANISNEKDSAVTQIPATNGHNADEVHITEVLGPEQVVAKRVKEAESKGKVVTIN